VASWDDPEGSGGLTTQAETLGALENNIREAISVHFEPEDIPKQIRIHFCGRSGACGGVRLPRGVSGTDVIRALEQMGFKVLRQAGSHVWLAGVYKL
jgi:hypothetical protein